MTSWREALATATTFAEIQAVVRRTARTLAQSDGATFVLRDGDKCFYCDEDAIAPLWKGQRFPVTHCISGWSMIHQLPAVIPNIMVDERIPLDAYLPTFVRSLAMVPIREDDPVGAIGAYWADQHAATPDEVAALRDLAAEAAVAIDRVGLEHAPWAPSFSAPEDASV
ncbi:MAG TPA: GAF domain-containing protein [Nocardioidaceae bacterium]|nr:GAF domain-containing protein [Nocardioidaceae bacterium]